MERFGRIVKWLFLGAAALLLLVVGAALIYVRSEHFTRWLREEGLAAVNQAIRGTIAVERLEGSVWRDVTLYNVALRHENAEIVQIPRLHVSFSLWRLFWGELSISQIDAFKPLVNLRQDDEKRWNVVEALGPREPKPEQKSEFTTLINSLRLRDAAIDLRLAGKEEKLYRLQNLDLEAGLGVLPDGVSLEVHELLTGLVSKGLPELRLKGALGYQQMAASPATLKVNELWAVSRNSRVKLDGEMNHRDATKIKARATVEKLAPADIAYFVPDWPLKRDIAGNLVIEGALDDLNGNLDLAGAGARIGGKFRADVEQSPPRYSANVTVSGFDLRQWLERAELAGVVHGAVEARGNGFGLEGIAAKTQLEVRSAQVQGWGLGTVATEGRLENGIATFDGRLEGGLGSANWSGKVALKEKRPTYDLALAVKDLAIEKALQDAEKMTGKLNLQGTVKGAGFSLADMNTRAELKILPSSVGAVNLQAGALDAVLRDKKIFISRASLNTAESALAVNGELGLDAGAAGKLDYRFRATDVAPWLSLFNQKGSGSINLSGQAQGSLADLQTQGVVRLSGVRLEGAAIRDGDVKFSLRGSKDNVFPTGVVAFRVAGLDAGLTLSRVDGKAVLARAPAQTIQLEINAQDSAERKHGLNGVVNLSPEVVALRLNQAALSGPDGTWKLSRPATLSKEKDFFVIEQLSLRNGERQVAVEGRVGFSGSQDLRFNVERLPLETLAAFMAQPPKVSGIIDLTARVSGTAAAPEITSTLKLNEPTVAGQPYAGAFAEVHYKDRRAALRMAIQQDAAHTLTANGTVPLLLSWNEKFRYEPATGMDVRVQSSGLSVAFLNAFGGKAVENVGGELAVDVTARGSITQPDLRGTFQLREGKLKAVPLNVDVAALTINGGFDSRNLVIRDISARAKDGEIRGSGSLALKQFDVSAVKLSLTAQRWPAIDTMRYQIRVGGKVDVEGSLAAPAVKGQLTITEGLVRPDLAFLEQSKAPTKRDETIVLVGTNAAGARAGQASNGSKEDSDVFKNLVLDVGMRVPGNLWVRHPDLVAELSGNIKVSKTRERPVDVTGRVDVVRGWFAFQGRRFQLVRGAAEFTGGDKINPSLDIAAQYKVRDYQVDIVVAGSAEKPTLTLTSQPSLEQADILALILFGRPINTLNQNEQTSLQQSAVNLASGFVAGKVAASVAKALGLEGLGIDISEVELGGGRIGLGKYIGSKTYVSASQQLTGERGHEVALEYELAPDWKVATSATSTGSSGIDIIWHKRY
ncbi:MAG TPA: translocation/assembly module TamB [Candidatus Binatia bacterium]|nr:translocation/assembly module TamB [Candidatus Binatia bacterium]